VAWSRRVMVSRVSVLACGLALVSSGARAQQSSQTVQEWTLQNVRASWCVHFLMDSTQADKEIPKEFRPVRAAEFPVLSPAVRNLITGEPEFAGWVPAQFCAYHFDQAKVGDQTLGDANPELDKTQFLGAWLIGAVPVGAAEAPTTASYYVATLRTPNWRFIRLAETSLIRMEYAEPLIGKVPESTEDRYRVEIGRRTSITWDGHLAGDSAQAASGAEQVWWSLNSRGARLRAEVRLTPEKSQSVAGTLQIAGNDPLAKSLRASPIRMVGPVNWGGSGWLSFSR
jgi:hypothetical protein